MADTITIGGKKVNKWVVYGGIGAAVIVGYIYFKNKNASNTSSATNPSAIDPVTGLPYSEDNTVDPLTGMTYLAEAQEYGSVSAAESAYAGNTSGSLGSSVGGSSSGLGYGYPTSNVGSSASTTTTYASNSDWGQSAIAALEAMGYSSADSTSAIAAYLAGMTLTSEQSQLVQLATAEIGPPPTSIAVQTTPASSNSGSTTTTTGTSSPTSSTSSGSTTASKSTSYQFPAPQNLSAGSGGKGKINVSWAPVVGPGGQQPTGYTVAYGRTSGAQTWENVVKGTSTTLNTQSGNDGIYRSLG